MTYPPPPPPAENTPNTQKVGFFGGMFDIGFKHQVGQQIASVLYVLSIVVLGIGYIFAVAGGFMVSGGLGLVYLVVGPLVVLLYLMLIRIYLEVAIAVFEIDKNTKRSADALDRR